MAKSRSTVWARTLRGTLVLLEALASVLRRSAGLCSMLRVRRRLRVVVVALACLMVTAAHQIEIHPYIRICVASLLQMREPEQPMATMWTLDNRNKAENVIVHISPHTFAGHALWRCRRTTDRAGYRFR